MKASSHKGEAYELSFSLNTKPLNHRASPMQLESCSF
jgi:hypothetical protein